MLKRQFIGVVCTTIIALAISEIHVMATDDWKSNYKDISQISGTEYFLIHLYDVQTDDGFGYVCGVANKDGNIVLPVKYGSVDTENISDKRRRVITLSGKHGFVDENFNIAIEPTFDMAWSFEKGAARVRKNNTDGTSRIFYIDINGNEVPDPTPESERDFEYYSTLTGQELDMAIFNRLGDSDYAVCQKNGGKYGIINVKTREYLSPQKWDNIAVDKSATAWAQTMGEDGMYDTTAIKLDASEEFKFKSERIAGVADDGYLFIVKPVSVKQKPYDNIEAELTDSFIPRYGLMAPDGYVIIEPVWDAPAGWFGYMPGYQDGYLIGQRNSKNYEYIKGIGTVGDGKWGCVTVTGEVIIDPIYDHLNYMGYGRFYADTADGYSILGSEGKPLPKSPYLFTLTNTSPSTWATEAIADAFELGLIKTDEVTAFDHHTYQWNITRQQFCELAVNMFVKVKGEAALPVITVANTFTDTKNKYVLEAYELGILKGKGNSIFDPFAEITRQEAATMLINLATVLDISPTAEPLQFDDETDFASWAKESIFSVTAIQNAGQRVMSGVGNNLFSPLRPYTVEQAIITVLQLYKSYQEV